MTSVLDTSEREIEHGHGMIANAIAERQEVRCGQNGCEQGTEQASALGPMISPETVRASVDRLGPHMRDEIFGEPAKFHAEIVSRHIPRSSRALGLFATDRRKSYERPELGKIKAQTRFVFKFAHFGTWLRQILRCSERGTTDVA